MYLVWWLWLTSKCVAQNFLWSTINNIIVSGEVTLSAEYSGQPLGSRGSAPTPPGELTALPRLPSWWGGDLLPLPENPSPLLAFGHHIWPFWPHSTVFPNSLLCPPVLMCLDKTLRPHQSLYLKIPHWPCVSKFPLRFLL